jgi:hypothetical protein
MEGGEIVAEAHSGNRPVDAGLSGAPGLQESAAWGPEESGASAVEQRSTKAPLCSPVEADGESVATADMQAASCGSKVAAVRDAGTGGWHEERWCTAGSSLKHVLQATVVGCVESEVHEAGHALSTQLEQSLQGNESCTESSSASSNVAASDFKSALSLVDEIHKATDVTAQAARHLDAKCVGAVWNTKVYRELWKLALRAGEEQENAGTHTVDESGRMDAPVLESISAHYPSSDGVNSTAT